MGQFEDCRMCVHSDGINVFYPCDEAPLQVSTACRCIWKAVVKRDYLPLLSVCLHRTSRLLQDGFLWNFEFGIFTKIWHVPVFIKTWKHSRQFTCILNVHLSCHNRQTGRQTLFPVRYELYPEKRVTVLNITFEQDKVFC